MKTITNITFSVSDNPLSKHMSTTASLLKLTLSQPPAQGFDFTTMRLRNRIADVADRGGDLLSFEDSDFAAAKECVAAYRWGAAHPDLIKFAEQFGL